MRLWVRPCWEVAKPWHGHPHHSGSLDFYQHYLPPLLLVRHQTHKGFVSNQPECHSAEAGKWTELWRDLEAGGHRRAERGEDSPSVARQRKAENTAHRKAGLESPRCFHVVLPCSVLEVDVLMRPQSVLLIR